MKLTPLKFRRAVAGVALIGAITVSGFVPANAAEACDVLLKDGTFIHVKNISSSAPASHLLAQALVSTEVLTYDSQARGHLKSYISEAGEDPAQYQLKPRAVLIVLAKDGIAVGPEDLFTFTQVNLARQVVRLDEQQIAVHIASVARQPRTYPS